MFNNSNDNDGNKTQTFTSTKSGKLKPFFFLKSESCINYVSPFIAKFSSELQIKDFVKGQVTDFV